MGLLYPHIEEDENLGPVTLGDVRRAADHRFRTSNASRAVVLFPAVTLMLIGVAGRGGPLALGWLIGLVWMGLCTVALPRLMPNRYRRAYQAELRARTGVVCESCGYELEGLPRGYAHCPECGQIRPISPRRRRVDTA